MPALPGSIFFTLLATLLSTTLTLPPPTLYEGDTCQMTSGAQGICRLIKECPSVVSNLNRVKPQRCGFSGNTEIVCCPLDTRKPTQTPKPTPTVPTTSRQTLSPSQQACENYRKSIPLSLNTFIYGGSEASANEFPHMAALGYRVRGQGDLTWSCGGTLISSTFVLTAAHCTKHRELGDPVVVRLGQLDLSTDMNELVSEVAVSNVIRHPNYKGSSAYWDIALLELAQPVSFGRAVHPACLHNGPNPALDTPLIVCGWGAINERNTLKSNVLLKATIQQVELSQCNETYGTGSTRITLRGVNSDMICAAHPEGTQDVCEGDSGGPLQIQIDHDRDLFSIIGLTSAGPAICGGITPTIFTRVASYIDWIESNVWPTRGTRTINNNSAFVENPYWPIEYHRPIWLSSSKDKRRYQPRREPSFWSIN